MCKRTGVIAVILNVFSLFVITLIFGRYEDYVDQKYKEHLKNQGKVDSVRTITQRHTLLPDC